MNEPFRTARNKGFLSLRSHGRKMKQIGDSMRGFGIGLVVAGAGAFFFPHCTGAISMILGVCAVVLGYRALDAEREMVEKRKVD